MDPFATLGVEPRFELDLAQLELRHRELSKALHPDRYAGTPAAERRMALGKAIEVNEAFRTLKDPVKRAEALLRRAGVPVGELAEPKPSPELLMEFMESREELSEAAKRRDAAAISKLGAAMRERQAQTMASLGKAFANALGAEAGGDAAAQLAGVLPVLGELRYVRRFLDEVGAIEEELAEA